jgi:Tfp pilus assembly protein PilV
MPSPAPRSRARASEAGFALIEVMAAAVLLVVISLATLSVFDTTGKISASAKARSIAANLAQQDQERLRAMKAVDLSNYHATNPVTVAGAGAFTVDSRAEWVRDAGGVESCTVSSTQADYVRITSTVSAGILSKPVTLATLVAPPIASFDANTGTLTVNVTDRAGVAVSGADVSVSGPTAVSDTTNSLGCAVFSHIPAGTYAIKTQKSGYVDKNGNDPGSLSGVVTAGKVVTYPATLDVAATATASIQTVVTNDTAASVGLAAGTWMTSSWDALTADPQTPGGEPNDVTSPSSFQSSIQTTGLFPFLEGDTFFTGSCAGADPGTAISNYWSSNPGLVKPLDQGGTYNVTVRQPPLVVRLKNSSGGVQGGAHVVITPTASGCSADKTVMTTDANGYVTKTGGTFDSGVPFGSYTVCTDVEATPQTNPRTYYVKSQTVQANSLNPSRTDMQLPATTTTVPCS